MSTLPERAAAALLVVAGLLTVAPLLALAPPASAGAIRPMLTHWQFMNGLLGLGLLAAAFVPPLRMAVVSGAVLSKAAFLVLVVLGPVAEPVRQAGWIDAGALVLALVAGGLFWQAALRQARWDGALVWRQER